MLKMDLYIHSVGVVAPSADMPVSDNKRLALEPDYTQWIPPNQLRRTSKAVRMGIGAAKLCTTATKCENPDAISLGTAMGCLKDTEVFLSKMVSQDEKMLTPTSFIQSTHNTVGGQIALLMGCNGHNMTYVQRGHSFEHALINAKLYLQDHPGQTVLAGGIDELTPSSHLLMQRAGVYTDLAATKGAIAGEGASFFLVNEKASGALARLTALRLLSSERSGDAITALKEFLGQTTPEFLLMGDPKSPGTANFYAKVYPLFPDAKIICFKDTCGEYPTASAYALSVIVEEMNADNLQDNNNAELSHPKYRTGLIINNYCDDYSFMLIESL